MKIFCDLPSLINNYGMILIIILYTKINKILVLNSKKTMKSAIKNTISHNNCEKRAKSKNYH